MFVILEATMRRINPYDPGISQALTVKGLTVSMLLDMSPLDMEFELAQAALSGGYAANNNINSTGMDNEIRAFEAGRGQEELLGHVLPDVVEDPFRDAMEAGKDVVQDSSMYDYPEGIPDLVMHATLGF
jgi:hypothetical protein